jgi:tryptophan synthase alpha chain
VSRLHEAFAAAKAEGRALLVGYLPAGFPARGDDVAVIEAMVRGGVEAIEVGLPYSDPLMDGATIQDAVQRALEAGTHTDDVLETVRGVAATGVPTLVMSYWNPLERYGVERFARDLAAAGGVGVITPDLTPEEAGPWIAATDAAGIERVFLVAPSSTDDRIATVAAASSGFVYAASTMGVTGARATVGGGAQALVQRTQAHTSLPVAVGVGVSTGEQAAEVAAYADGVIVGSAFVRAVLDAEGTAAACEAVERLASELAAGVRRHAAPVG